MTTETVIDIAEAVRRGERKAVDVLDEHLARVNEGNDRLNAFVHLDPELAHAAAEAVDTVVARCDDPGQQLVADVAAIFDEVDVILCPTTAVPAFAAAGPPPTEIAGREVPNGAMATPFTMLANLCWNPAISVPAGLTADGLPVGLQVIGRRHEDEVCLRLARLLEVARPWERTAPKT